MIINPLIKEKVRVKEPRRPTVPALSFHMADSASETEIQRRLDNAFDIFFTEVFKNNGDKLV